MAKKDKVLKNKKLVKKKKVVEKVEDKSSIAKKLSKQGLTTKEVANVMKCDKYEASKLIKE